jgi:hypothetical protein
LKKTLVLKRETLAELATADLLLVRGGAVPAPTYNGTVCQLPEKVTNVVATVKNAATAIVTLTTATGITDLC